MGLVAKRAFVLGGTGFVGRHITLILADTGWDVMVGSRGETGIPVEISGACKLVNLDRSNDDDLRRALGSGTDVLVDVIPYERRDPEQLLALQDLVGSVVAISTAAVYRDDEGRSLETIARGDYPRLPNPIPESQPTVDPRDETYATKKAAIERMLLGQDELAATVIRPCAVYGPGDTLCREWFFVKRALDRRLRVLLAYEGKSVFHTTSVHNLAELVRLAADRPGTRVLNCGDPDPPDVLRISRRIAELVGHEWKEVPVPSEVSAEPFVRNPWGSPWPFLLDMTRAKDELGYEPVTTYEDAIAETVDWICNVATGDDWKKALPRTAEYLAERFEYEAEDEYVKREDLNN